jgi:excisionase family DNA binding protein
MCKTKEELIAEVTEGKAAVVNASAAAAYLNCHERTIARMCELGKLKAVKVMSVWRINREALIDFANNEA